MAAWFLQRLTLQAMKTENNCIARCLGKHLVQKTAPAQLSVTVSVLRLPSLIHAKAFSVAEEAQKKKKKKKETEAAFISVGRKIRDGIVQVFDEKGNDLGHMQQADVIELMNTRELRLVKRITRAEPPVYQLMTGLQIHEERMKLREREKAEPKTGPTLTKKLTFSSNIEQHDLDTKSKQIQQWIKKKHQVQITIKKGKNVEEPEAKTEAVFNQILQTMPAIATFSSKPHAIRGGRAVVCVLRHLSTEEENAYRESQKTQKGDILDKENRNDRQPDVLHQ
ncbi:translation initiation factor IF-3, mitochondrial isoform X1 [Loxodonta africana]|uniref:translation initiation factor IF-3, mitochondrial isoform X1 n=1 Tax=Loxodonta africana TaxID=9785 RepID=UPI0002234BEF|nr:translation initiation factor IF-3, mitochondrial [Loxodonta africana]XP_023408911.1 translation initiation factor IF-3, mitochondrial [Loxodonta africana]